MSIIHETWAPYEPSKSDPWDLRKVAHLHRRAGFGATFQELQRDLRAGPEESIARILQGRPQTPEEADTFQALRQGIESSTDGRERLQAYGFHRILFDPHPLREKLTLFWHGHFATSNIKVQSDRLMAEQNDTLRRHALGNFGELVEQVTTDPAMLIWLDGVNSPKQKPNENLARELLELFLLGAGNYTEADIRSAARALTGWTRSDRSSAVWDQKPMRFDRKRFDDGQKTFLGKTGPWNSSDIVRIALDHPAAAPFICRKLYRYLVADVDSPPETLIAQLAKELRQSDYSIDCIIGIILRSKHFFSSSAYRQRIASPVELSAGLVRILGIPRAKIRLLAIAQACRRQGQHLFFPPNVAGWKGGRHWMTSINVVHRGNWLTDVVWGNPNHGLPPFDPIEWCESNGIPRNDAAVALADHLLQGDASQNVLTMVRQAAKPKDAVNLRKAIQLLLYCPEFQLV